MAGNGSSSNTVPSSELSPARSNSIVEICTKAVNDYRERKLSKAQAVFTISDQLRGTSDGEESSSRDVALQSYINMLDEIDRLRAGGAEEPRTEGRESSSGPGGRESNSGTAREHEHTTRRSHSPGSDGADSESSGDSNDDERPSKRARVSPTQYAWAADEYLLEPQLRPEVQRTLDLIRVYGEDITQAKRDLAASASAPEFPDAEWTNVLLGRAVDLDHVFAGRYSTAADDKITEKFGDLELRYRAPVPAKRIRTFGDWVYAWGRATTATAFAFPHRRMELTNYKEHIIRLFGALAEPLHERVLEYDRAVRKRVGSARRFLLTDFNDFADLKIQTSQLPTPEGGVSQLEPRRMSP
ncbi:hypothetical protein NUW54_g166 [Trametes sanguinea]|uniref:Uncharacterized protein n=1 Tax=Trametes sanguinea TaxID=158606 RepID=A0ACC1QA65_9APHY|nr:hypothetical protein NUW54_g166 [Trametes sanguinea]